MKGIIFCLPKSSPERRSLSRFRRHERKVGGTILTLFSSRCRLRWCPPPSVGRLSPVEVPRWLQAIISASHMVQPRSTGNLSETG